MKFSKLGALALLVGASALSNSAFAQPVKSTGGVMTDSQGKTLYIFTKDAPKQSNCSAGCLAAWPAFVAKPEAKPSGDLGVIVREDGTQQWTHKDRPLYYYVGDSKPVDKTGDKQNGVWFVLPMTADGKVSSAPGTAASGGYTY
jgi:predicted lipoprotein with Yx(FWY)xxD motif